MHWYRIRAEHVSKLDISKITAEMEALDPGIEVIASGPCHIFEGDALWIVQSHEAMGNQLQDVVWRYNNGACCDQSEIEQDQVEDWL